MIMKQKRVEDYFKNREIGIQGAVGEFAILVPLVRWEGQLCLLFETRSETLKGHQPNEVCFPGGRREKGETPEQTALRETWEELGIPEDSVRIIAPLDIAQDISDRVIYPFLGEVSPEAASHLMTNRDEVKNVFFVPLEYLLNYPEEVYRYPVRPIVDDTFPGEKVGFPDGYSWRTGWMDVPIYEYEGHAIWGMTGRMVRWFLQHLKKLEDEPEV